MNSFEAVAAVLKRYGITFRDFSDIECYMTDVKLGEGTYGRVFKAYFRVPGETSAYCWKPIAVKQVWLSETDAEAVEADTITIAREVRHCRQALGSRVTAIWDPWYDRGMLCVPVELCDMNLHHYARACCGFEFPDGFLIAMLHDCLRALSHVHAAGITHCDVKPDNIFVVLPRDEGDGTGPERAAAEPPTIKIGDFGISCRADERIAAMTGTPYFMAPECCADGTRREPPGARDVWALGVSFYYLLTAGRYPFEGPNTAAVLQRARQGLPDGVLPHPPAAGGVSEEEAAAVEAAIVRMLALDPRERPTADALAAEIAASGLQRWGPPLRPKLSARCRSMAVHARAAVPVVSALRRGPERCRVGALQYGDRVMVSGEVTLMSPAAGGAPATPVVWYRIAYPVVGFVRRCDADGRPTLVPTRPAALALPASPRGAARAQATPSPSPTPAGRGGPDPLTPRRQQQQQHGQPPSPGSDVFYSPTRAAGAPSPRRSRAVPASPQAMPRKRPAAAARAAPRRSPYSPSPSPSPRGGLVCRPPRAAPASPAELSESWGSPMRAPGVRAPVAGAGGVCRRLDFAPRRGPSPLPPPRVFGQRSARAGNRQRQNVHEDSNSASATESTASLTAPTEAADKLTTIGSLTGDTASTVLAPRMRAPAPAAGGQQRRAPRPRHNHCRQPHYEDECSGCGGSDAADDDEEERQFADLIESEFDDGSDAHAHGHAQHHRQQSHYLSYKDEKQKGQKAPRHRCGNANKNNGGGAWDGTASSAAEALASVNSDVMSSASSLSSLPHHRGGGRQRRKHQQQQQQQQQQTPAGKRHAKSGKKTRGADSLADVPSPSAFASGEAGAIVSPRGKGKEKGAKKGFFNRLFAKG